MNNPSVPPGQQLLSASSKVLLHCLHRKAKPKFKTPKQVKRTDHGLSCVTSHSDRVHITQENNAPEFAVY